MGFIPWKANRGEASTEQAPMRACSAAADFGVMARRMLASKGKANVRLRRPCPLRAAGPGELQRRRLRQGRQGRLL